mmetsp:Transcript_34162/g.107690  ORF Transcript_34162/g.107690 Transcript_34162/m.107690 type:complete len:364 (-) Transcript_34162:481-1572(-)
MVLREASGTEAGLGGSAAAPSGPKICRFIICRPSSYTALTMRRSSRFCAALMLSILFSRCSTRRWRACASSFTICRLCVYFSCTVLSARFVNASIFSFSDTSRATSASRSDSDLVSDSLRTVSRPDSSSCARRLFSSLSMAFEADCASAPRLSASPRSRASSCSSSAQRFFSRSSASSRSLFTRRASSRSARSSASPSLLALAAAAAAAPAAAPPAAAAPACSRRLAASWRSTAFSCSSRSAFSRSSMASPKTPVSAGAASPLMEGRSFAARTSSRRDAMRSSSSARSEAASSRSPRSRKISASLTAASLSASNLSCSALDAFSLYCSARVRSAATSLTSASSASTCWKYSAALASCSSRRFG